MYDNLTKRLLFPVQLGKCAIQIAGKNTTLFIWRFSFSVPYHVLFTLSEDHCISLFYQFMVCK